MPTRYVARTSNLQGKAGLPNANSIRVDKDTEELKFGYGASGTNEKIVVDLDTFMAFRDSLSARVEALEARFAPPAPPEDEPPEKNSRRKKTERNEE